MRTQDAYLAPELRRPVLERAARGAGVRPAGRLPRERRAPRARRRGRAAVRRGRGARRGARAARRRARRAARGDLDAPDRVGRRPLPRGPRARRRHLESRDRGELPPTRRPRRPASRRQAARPSRRLARPRRALPLGRLDGGHVARRAGAQEPARPLGLPGDHGRDAAGARRRDGHVPRRERVLPRVDLRPARRPGEVVSIDVEQVRDDYPAHPRITYLGGRSSTDPDVVADVRARAEGKPTLVILDSDHSQAHVEAELAVYADTRPGRRLPDRRGLEHRADPQGPAARAARGDRDVPRRHRRRSRSTAAARSS